MQDLTILGAGTSGFALTKSIKEKNPKCKITLVDKNPKYLDKVNIFSSFSLKGRVDLASWCKENSVDFICDRIDRVNLRRKKIYFKYSPIKSFDSLIIATGLSSKKLTIKGEHRDGFYYFSDIDVAQANTLLRISPEVTIYVCTFLGLRLISTLLSLGKEVNAVIGTLDFLGEDKDRTISYLIKAGVRLYFDTVIEEAIGESALRAVKINPLKVFSSQLLFIDSGFVPNTKFIEEDEFQVRDNFFSNFQGIYFLGDVADIGVEHQSFFLNNYEEALGLAQALADHLIDGRPAAFHREHISEEGKKIAVDNLLDSILLPVTQEPIAVTGENIENIIEESTKVVDNDDNNLETTVENNRKEKTI